jgi:hypothetical protein
MRTLWCKNQENPSDRISHAWAPLNEKLKKPFRINKKNSLPLFFRKRCAEKLRTELQRTVNTICEDGSCRETVRYSTVAISV